MKFIEQDGTELFKIQDPKSVIATVDGKQIPVRAHFVEFSTPLSKRAKEVAEALGLRPEGTVHIVEDGAPFSVSRYIAYRVEGKWFFFEFGSKTPKIGSLSGD